MKICNYWSESNSLIYFYIVLNKNWKMYRSEHSFTGLGPKDRCSSWGLVPEDRCSLWGFGSEDRCSLWGLGPEDQCSSWSLGQEDRCSLWGLVPEERWSSWGLLLMPFGFITPKHVLNYLVFHSFGFERIRWRLF
jgi:hypothetical protein